MSEWTEKKNVNERANEWVMETRRRSQTGFFVHFISDSRCCRFLRHFVFCSSCIQVKNLFAAVIFVSCLSFFSLPLLRLLRSICWLFRCRYRRCRRHHSTDEWNIANEDIKKKLVSSFHWLNAHHISLPFGYERCEQIERKNCRLFASPLLLFGFFFICQQKFHFENEGKISNKMCIALAVAVAVAGVCWFVDEIRLRSFAASFCYNFFTNYLRFSYSFWDDKTFDGGKPNRVEWYFESKDKKIEWKKLCSWRRRKRIHIFFLCTDKWNVSDRFAACTAQRTRVAVWVSTAAIKWFLFDSRRNGKIIDTENVFSLCIWQCGFRLFYPRSSLVNCSQYSFRRRLLGWVCRSAAQKFLMRSIDLVSCSRRLVISWYFEKVRLVVVLLAININFDRLMFRTWNFLTWRQMAQQQLSFGFLFACHSLTSIYTESTLVSVESSHIFLSCCHLSRSLLLSLRSLSMAVRFRTCIEDEQKNKSTERQSIKCLLLCDFRLD